MTTKHTIYLGDSRSMAEVAEGSVHLIVTSPPYWQLKDYGNPEQIGYGQTYEEYINHLNLVWAQCVRVLHPGCRLCINVGDQFARSVYYGRYKVVPIRAEIIRCCEALGLDYMGGIIWQKATTSNTSGGGAVMGSYPYPRNGVLRIDYEFILLFKKPGKGPGVAPEIKAQAQLTPQDWNRWFSGHWQFAGLRQDRHLAAFPLELPLRLIRMFSFPGETVLDPFAGSGTTTVAAAQLGRHSIGYEINPQFETLIRTRLAEQAADLSPGPELEFRSSPPLAADDWEAAIERLPYRFHDPHALDVRFDPKHQTYGSKIDGRESKPAYQRVRRVLAPDTVETQTGLQLRLLGVRAVPERAGQALAFLEKTLKGNPVLIRTDPACPEVEGLPAVYLFLKNKTFINAHLIKRGLATVDQEHDYRHRQRFLKYAP